MYHKLDTYEQIPVKFESKAIIFINGNAFENVVCKIACFGFNVLVTPWYSRHSNGTICVQITETVCDCGSFIWLRNINVSLKLRRNFARQLYVANTFQSHGLRHSPLFRYIPNRQVNWDRTQVKDIVIWPVILYHINHIHDWIRK